MSKKQRVSVLLYAVFFAVVVLSSFEYARGLLVFDYYALIIGSSLSFFQLIFAIHLHWEQRFSEDEFKALVIIFYNQCRRTIIKKIYDSGPIWANKLVNETGFSFSKISANLNELENESIIIEKLKLLPNSSRALRMYEISPGYEKIVKKIRSRL